MRVAWWVTAALIAMPAIAQQSSLSVSVSGTALSVSGVERGGSVVVAGVSLKSEGGIRRERRFSTVLVDDDKDGLVLFEPEGGVPRRSVWIAVDFRSGAVATAGGPDYGEHRTQFPESSVKREVEQLFDVYEGTAVEIDLLIVRPGDGAWVRAAIEGEAGDEDRVRNDVIRATLAAARPVDPRFGDAPKKVKKGDVVAIVDVRHLQVAFTTIEK